MTLVLEHEDLKLLKEGGDFYWEEGLLVFTADYLCRRGFCCKNGCRHCPFGFREKQMAAKILIR